VVPRSRRALPRRPVASGAPRKSRRPAPSPPSRSRRLLAQHRSRRRQRGPRRVVSAVEVLLFEGEGRLFRVGEDAEDGLLLLFSLGPGPSSPDFPSDGPLLHAASRRADLHPRLSSHLHWFASSSRKKEWLAAVFTARNESPVVTAHEVVSQGTSSFSLSRKSSESVLDPLPGEVPSALSSFLLTSETFQLHTARTFTSEGSGYRNPRCSSESPKTAVCESCSRLGSPGNRCIRETPASSRTARSFSGGDTVTR